MNFAFDFKGRTALVTGGVSGIGGAASRAFRAAGAHVIACGLTEAVTEGVASDIIDIIAEYSHRPLPVVLTIPDSSGKRGAAMEKIRRTVERALGADILFGKEGNA